MRCTGVADPGNAQHALLCQNLLRAANDGYDVSTLIDHGADPMTSGTLCQPAQTPWQRRESGAPKRRRQRGRPTGAARTRHIAAPAAAVPPPRPPPPLARVAQFREETLEWSSCYSRRTTDAGQCGHVRAGALRTLVLRILVQSPPGERGRQKMLLRVCMCECVFA